jgi:acyl-CoA thioesterase FadM
MRLRQEVTRDNDGARELLIEAVVELAAVSSETFRPVALPGFLTPFNELTVKT